MSNPEISVVSALLPSEQKVLNISWVILLSGRLFSPPAQAASPPEDRPLPEIRSPEQSRVSLTRHLQFAVFLTRRRVGARAPPIRFPIGFFGVAQLFPVFLCGQYLLCSVETRRFGGTSSFTAFLLLFSWGFFWLFGLLWMSKRM